MGDTVLAQLPDSNGGKEEYTTAITRWIGERLGYEHLFEVESVLVGGWWGNVVNVPPPYHQVLDRIVLSNKMPTPHPTLGKKTMCLNPLDLGNCSGIDSEVPSDWLMISCSRTNSYGEEGMQ